MSFDKSSTQTSRFFSVSNVINKDISLPTIWKYGSIHTCTFVSVWLAEVLHFWLQVTYIHLVENRYIYYVLSKYRKQYWSLLNWHTLRFRCGCVAVPVKLFFDVISSSFSKFKNVVHSLEPGETPSNSASHQAPHYVKYS